MDAQYLKFSRSVSIFRLFPALVTWKNHCPKRKPSVEIQLDLIKELLLTDERPLTIPDLFCVSLGGSFIALTIPVTLVGDTSRLQELRFDRLLSSLWTGHVWP